MNENKFWIDATFEDEIKEEKTWQAIQIMQVVHNYTIEQLNDHYTKNHSLLAYMQYRDKLDTFIRKERLWRLTQRYSIERAAEKSFPYFSQQLKFDYQNQPIYVCPDRILEIQIKSRKVWKKYLANGGGLTTWYGSIFLEKGWKKTLREQAGEVALDLFPFLWHSITLRCDLVQRKWQVKLGFHAEKSKAGERARQEFIKTYGDT